jgi:flagellar basal body rod protein FlgB
MGNNIINDLKSAMLHSNEQIKVINSNIAKADQPNAKAFILPPLETSIKSKGGKLSMVATSGMHLKGHKNDNTQLHAVKMKDPFETNINGNNINIPQQNLLLNDATMNNKIAIEGYKKYNSMLKTSISSK